MEKITVGKILAQVVKQNTRKKFEDFRNYTLVVESKFSQDKSKLEVQYHKQSKDLTDEELHYIHDYFSDEYHQIENIYIGMYRKSTLISIYTLLESSLHDLCEHLCRLNAYSESVTESRGEGVKRSINYLKKWAGVDITPINSSWAHISSMAKLRNCIVHCDGKISTYKLKKDIENIVCNNNDLSLVDVGRLSLNRRYLDVTINEIEVLLDSIYAQTLNVT